MRELSTDILILGSGGAGLFAALHAHKADPSLSITVDTPQVEALANRERELLDTLRFGPAPASPALRTTGR